VLDGWIEGFCLLLVMLIEGCIGTLHSNMRLSLMVRYKLRVAKLFTW